MFNNEVYFGGLYLDYLQWYPGLRSVPLPAYTLGHPLMVGRGGVNLVKSSPSQESPAPTPNSSTLIDRSALASFGVTVQPPCSGPIFHLTAPLDYLGNWNVQKDLGAWDVTDTLVPHFSDGSNLKLRMYIYPLSTDPGLTPTAASTVFNVDVGKSDPNPNPPHQSFFFPSLQVVGDSVGGWVPITLDTNTKTWGGTMSNPFKAFLHFWTGYQEQYPNPCDVLVAIDSLNCDMATGGPIDHTGIALPTDTTTSYGPEIAKVSGFSCGTNWTMEVVGEVPEDASDITVPIDGRPSLDQRVLCSFLQTNVGAITVHADMPSDIQGAQVVFRIPGCADVHVKPPVGSGEQFLFTRGSAVFVAVTFDGISYNCYASVGHSTVYSSSTSPVTSVLHPDTIYFGGWDGTPPECMLWWGGRAHQSTALKLSDVVKSWSLLNLLFSRTTLVRPVLD
jgi:hypothetical protein